MRIFTAYMKAILVCQPGDDGVICMVALSRTRLIGLLSGIGNPGLIDFDPDLS
jgi:hypothetical protein